MRTSIIYIASILLFSSCSFLFTHESYKKVNLREEIPTNKFISYENSKVIMYFITIDILNFLEAALKDEKICSQVQQRNLILYNQLNQLNNLNRNGFIIESNDLIDYSTYLFTLKQKNKESLTKEYYLEKIVPKIPYGFHPETADTLKSTKFNNIDKGILSALVVKGKACIYRKETRKFQKFIKKFTWYTNDGHGMSYLVFSDKIRFYDISFYSDFILPDFDCMEENEIEKFLGLK